MSLDLAKLLHLVETASATMSAAQSIAADAVMLLSPAEQDTLRVRLASLQQENDVGHQRLQDKLDAIIKKEGGHG